MLSGWKPCRVGPASNEITPGKHFGTYSERSVAYGSKGGPVDTGVLQRMCVDYYIESVGGGITRLRLVQSGFGPEAAWDDEFAETKTGWADYLKKLKELVEAAWTR